MADIADRSSLLREIQDVLDGNGSIPQAKKDRLMFVMISEIYRGVMDTIDRVEQVEGRIRDIEQWQEQTKPFISGVRWITAGLCSLILVLLWGVLTHSVTIHIP